MTCVHACWKGKNTEIAAGFREIKQTTTASQRTLNYSGKTRIKKMLRTKNPAPKQTWTILPRSTLDHNRGLQSWIRIPPLLPTLHLCHRDLPANEQIWEKTDPPF